MPKMKTHKGVKKRVRISAKGRVKHRHANTGHLMSGKSGNRCRGLRQPGVFSKAFETKLRDALAGVKA